MHKVAAPQQFLRLLWQWVPAGESLAGRAVAIAEGNALGKGPVVFELPPSGIALVRARAALGDPVFMQLEVRSPGTYSFGSRCWPLVPFI
jgi:hypothetical protein